jgi:hypothetical protein
VPGPCHHTNAARPSPTHPRLLNRVSREGSGHPVMPPSARYGVLRQRIEPAHGRAKMSMPRGTYARYQDWPRPEGMIYAWATAYSDP